MPEKNAHGGSVPRVGMRNPTDGEVARIRPGSQTIQHCRRDWCLADTHTQGQITWACRGLSVTSPPSLGGYIAPWVLTRISFGILLGLNPKPNL